MAELCTLVNEQGWWIPSTRLCEWYYIDDNFKVIGGSCDCIICQVQKQGLSFASSRELRQRIDLLPDTVPWKQTVVKVSGGSTSQPLNLFYRPGLDCFKFLFGNPLFASYTDLVPRREYTDGDKTERLYNEIMTGDRAWTLQVCTAWECNHSLDAQYNTQVILSIRTASNLVRPWGWSSWARTRHTSRLARAIKNATRYICHVEI